MSDPGREPIHEPNEDDGVSDGQDPVPDIESLPALPEMPAPPPIDEGGQELARGPIDIEDLDPELAKELLEVPIGLAAELVPKVDRFDAEKLIGAAVDLVVERAPEGALDCLNVKELAARARIGKGRVGQRFGFPLRVFGDLTARGVYAQAGRRVFFEEVSSQPTEVGRRNNGVGTDKVDQERNSLRALNYSLGAADRHGPSVVGALATGTRWDHASSRFGLPLPDWRAKYKGSIPGPFPEHLNEMLGVQHATRVAVGRALKDPGPAFTEVLTPERLRATVSKFLVVPLIPYGLPKDPYRDRAGIYVPGRDPETIKLTLAAKREGLLACGEPSPEELDEFERHSERLPVGELPSMYELGIRPEYAVEYRWSPKRHEVARYVVGKGSRVEIWRLVGISSPASFWRALALIERLSQVIWTEECLKRWEEDCRPNLLKAHHPETCNGVRSLLVAANAGIVDALRRQESDTEFE